MKTLSIDLETFSSVNIKDSGVYPYVESPDFEILLFAYAFDDEPVELIDLTDLAMIPENVMSALTDSRVLKTAFNANFERTALRVHTGWEMRPSEWQCSAVLAQYAGLPGYLEGAADALGLEARKDAKGKALIKYFSVPCKPTKINGGRTRNMPWHNPEKWQQYKDYNIQDVVVEREVRRKLLAQGPSQLEWDLWALDQKINDRGILVNYDLVENAIECNAAYQERIIIQAKELTGLDNPNSLPQLKGWIEDYGIEVESLNKETIVDVMKRAKDAGLDESVGKMLRYRKEMSKTSVKKYVAMMNARGKDGRTRGLLQFYGANRTGRWAGRLVQVQNLPQNKMEELDFVRQLLLMKDYDMIEFMYGSVPDVLSQLVRTAFVAKPGCRFIVDDFSAIEARVIAWCAGEQWRMDVFASHGKIYEASASQMFGIPLDEIDKALRQKGKISELALGYGGGVGALEKMGALKMGLSLDELDPLVKAWRKANKKITRFWWNVGDAAMKAVVTRRPQKLHPGLTFEVKGNTLYIELPSGRRLAYVDPKLRDGKFGKPVLTYMNVDQTTRKWIRTETYGPKLVENIVQAISRDCLGVAMLRLDKQGYDIVMHVHDEVVLEEPIGYSSVSEVSEILGQAIPWAPGLLLKAEGYETEYYKKD
jgi:DNA polymerase